VGEHGVGVREYGGVDDEVGYPPCSTAVRELGRAVEMGMILSGRVLEGQYLIITHHRC
jgi:hypothetical protein